MTKASQKRAAAPDIVATVQRYHDALDAKDFDAIESFFAETAVYVSEGVGVLEGREAIVAGFRTYFAEYGDQVAEDEEIGAISPRAVRSAWKLKATSSKTGQTSIRAGEETAFLDQYGFIEKVIVRDRRH